MYKIRKMTIDDIDRIVEIEKESFSIPWSKDSFLLELASPIAYYLVATDEENEVVGYGGMWLICGEGNVTNIGVKKDRRRQGIASMLIEGLVKYAVISDIEIIHLEVRESNIPAIALYENYGFKEVGRRKGYYVKPEEDALLLSLFLNKEV